MNAKATLLSDVSLVMGVATKIKESNLLSRSLLLSVNEPWNAFTLNECEKDVAFSWVLNALFSTIAMIMIEEAFVSFTFAQCECTLTKNLLFKATVQHNIT